MTLRDVWHWYVTTRNQLQLFGRYRNWVSHGRRTAKPAAVDPETAFRRLKEFLDVLGIGTEQSF